MSNNHLIDFIMPLKFQLSPLQLYKPLSCVYRALFGPGNTPKQKNALQRK